MLITKVITVGAATAAVLPDETLAKLGVKSGDDLYLIETSSGFLLTNKADLEAQLDAAERIMHKHRDVLRALSK